MIDIKKKPFKNKLLQLPLQIYLKIIFSLNTFYSDSKYLLSISKLFSI